MEAMKRLAKKQYAAAITMFLDAEEIARVNHIIDKILLEDMTFKYLSPKEQAKLNYDVDIHAVMHGALAYAGSCDRLILLERYCQYQLSIKVLRPLILTAGK